MKTTKTQRGPHYVCEAYDATEAPRLLTLAELEHVAPVTVASMRRNADDAGQLPLSFIGDNRAGEAYDAAAWTVDRITGIRVYVAAVDGTFSKTFTGPACVYRAAEYITTEFPEEGRVSTHGISRFVGYAIRAGVLPQYRDRAGLTVRSLILAAVDFTPPDRDESHDGDDSYAERMAARAAEDAAERCASDRNDRYYGGEF